MDENIFDKPKAKDETPGYPEKEYEYPGIINYKYAKQIIE